jgi:hypothetical protein
MYAFCCKNALIGRWVKARCRAERHEIAARYREWELVGEPEIRRPGGGWFNPWR